MNDILISFDFTSDEWNKLKLNYAELGLHLKCCDAQAIPKTSKLGTQFFAHKSDACGVGIESKEHLRCKELIVKGARNAGWQADPEEAGTDMENNAWVSDVLCSKGNLRFAFEVQLASQTFLELKRRTERYRNSGVECIWLIQFKRKNPISEQMILDRIQAKSRNEIFSDHHPDREDLPVFKIDVSNLNSIFVFFPFHHGKGPFQLPLDMFVFGALSGKLLFKEERWCWDA